MRIDDRHSWRQTVVMLSGIVCAAVVFALLHALHVGDVVAGIAAAIVGGGIAAFGELGID